MSICRTDTRAPADAGIGRDFVGRPWARAAAITVGAAVLAIDAAWIVQGRGWDSGSRLVLAAAATCALLVLARGDRATVGLRVSPVQGWRAWVRILAPILAVAVVFLGLVTLVLWLTGAMPPLPRLAPDEFVGRLQFGCVETPLFEEGLYRIAICVPLVGRRAWPAIVTSGLLFGALHVLYGNPAPDNLLAGYLFAWTYVRSGSIALPIALHAVGNLLVFSVHLGLWYAAR